MSENNISFLEIGVSEKQLILYYPAMKYISKRVIENQFTIVNKLENKSIQYKL